MGLSRSWRALFPVVLFVLLKTTSQQEFFEDAVRLENAVPEFETNFVSPAEEYDLPDNGNYVHVQEARQPYKEADTSDDEYATKDYSAKDNKEEDLSQGEITLDKPVPEVGSSPYTKKEQSSPIYGDGKNQYSDQVTDRDYESSGADTTLEIPTGNEESDSTPKAEAALKGNKNKVAKVVKAKDNSRAAPKKQKTKQLKGADQKHKSVPNVNSELKADSEKTVSTEEPDDDISDDDDDDDNDKEEEDDENTSLDNEELGKIVRSGKAEATKQKAAKVKDQSKKTSSAKAVDEDVHQSPDDMASEDVPNEGKEQKEDKKHNEKSHLKDISKEENSSRKKTSAVKKENDMHLDDEDEDDTSLDNEKLGKVVRSGKTHVEATKKKAAKVKDQSKKKHSTKTTKANDQAHVASTKSNKYKGNNLKSAKTSKKRETSDGEKSKGGLSDDIEEGEHQSPDEMESEDIPHEDDISGSKRNMVADREKRQTPQDEKIIEAKAKLRNAVLASSALTGMEQEMGLNPNEAEAKTKNLTSILRGEINKFKDLITNQNDEVKTSKFKKLEKLAEEDVKGANYILRMVTEIEAAKFLAKQQAKSKLELAVRDKISNPPPPPPLPPSSYQPQMYGDMATPMSPYQAQMPDFMAPNQPQMYSPVPFNPVPYYPPPLPPPASLPENPQNLQFSDTIQPLQRAPEPQPIAPAPAPPPEPFVNPAPPMNYQFATQQAPMLPFVNPYQQAAFAPQFNMYGYPGQQINMINAMAPPVPPQLPVYKPATLEKKPPKVAHTHAKHKVKVPAKPVNDRPKQASPPPKTVSPAGYRPFDPIGPTHAAQQSVPYSPSLMQSQPSYNAAYMQDVMGASSSRPFSDTFNRPNRPQNVQSYFPQPSQQQAAASPWNMQPPQKNKLPYIYEVPQAVKPNQKRPPPDLKKMLKTLVALHSNPRLLQQHLNTFNPAQQRPVVQSKPATPEPSHDAPIQAAPQMNNQYNEPLGINAFAPRPQFVQQQQSPPSVQQNISPMMQPNPQGMLPAQPPPAMQYTNPQPASRPFAAYNQQQYPFMNPSASTAPAPPLPSYQQDDEDEDDTEDNTFNDESAFNDQPAPMSPPFSDQFAPQQPPMQPYHDYMWNNAAAPHQEYGWPQAPYAAAQQYGGYQQPPQQPYQMVHPLIEEALTKIHNTKKAAEAVKNIENSIGLSPPAVNHIIDDVETETKKEKDQAEKDVKDEEAEIDKEKKLMNDKPDDTKPLEKKIEEEKKKLDENRKREEIAKKKLITIHHIEKILTLVEAAKASAMYRAKKHFEELKKGDYPDIKKRDLNDMEKEMHKKKRLHRRNDITIYMKGSNNTITASRLRDNSKKSKVAHREPNSIPRDIQYQVGNKFAAQVPDTKTTSSTIISKRNHIASKPKIGIILLKKLLERVDNLYEMQSKILNQLLKERQRNRRKRSLPWIHHRHHRHHHKTHINKSVKN